MSLSDQHISGLRQVARAPHILRAMVRGDEIWLTVLAAAVGATAGVCVWIMTRTTFRAHSILFSLPDGVRLSGAAYVLPWRLVAVPVCGGVAVGAFALLVARLLPRRPVDPIEANALHGGRMSVRDSLIVAFQTFLSNGCGGSVGLEAGFSQIAGAFGSWFGRSFRVRREDLRVLVGCGAGGAIGAAFGAPIAGAFYAFELVIGTYSAAKIAPVAMAAIGAVGVTHLLGGVTPAAEFPPVAPMDFRSVLPICVLGVGCGLVGIVVMKGVTLTESLFRRVPGPSILRPALGGLLLGGLALGSPSVLSAGHAAMHNILVYNPGAQQVGLLLVLKVLASAVCIGSGFRGGLFFAALYLGVLAGDGLGVVLHGVGLDALSVQACAIVGMNAMAVAIIGGPMTMTCLTLEMTGNPALAGAALLSGILSLVTVRRLFGYSFATWRFHLRGESIRSAVDIGWMRRLTVRRMMTGGIRTMTPETTLARARVLVPPGVASHIVLADGTGRYYGIVLVAELHNPMHDNAHRLADLAILRRHILLPNMNVRDAVQTFERAEADVLAVVDDDERRMVIGLLSEKHALRRYAEELDRTRRELAGEDRSRTYD